MLILNVAEKNDAAKNIASLLSRGSANRREGRSKFNKIYEFPYTFNGSNCQMLMTSVSGHLMNYAFPADKHNWKGVQPIELFDSPIFKMVPKEALNVKQSLVELARKVRMLIIWTDCDREGENIGMEIVDVCRSVNRNLQVKRAKFSEITAQSVTRAVLNLTEMDERQSQAVDVRQQLDLKTGAAFTRLQTLRLANIFPQSLSNQVISYGSCQFPTLGFVVERFKAVENFQPEPFWRLVLRHEKNGKQVEFTWERGRLFDESAVRTLLDHIHSTAPCGGSWVCVVAVSSKPKSKWRPFALDTVELEKLASRKLRISAKDTMGIAEKLYSQGFISYPRTETNIFPKEMNLASLVQVQLQDNRWADFANRVLAEGPNPHNGRKSDMAHPPIHPLKLGSGLSGREAAVYELVTRHFLACLSRNAEGHETRVTAEVVSTELGSPDQLWPAADPAAKRPCGLGETFSVTGLIVLARNYLEVYVYEKWSDRELPALSQGECWRAGTEQIVMEAGSTTAPGLLTEADLIALMDRHGVGTDATHAEHIDKVKQRQYVGCTGPDDKYLVPGQLGMGLVAGYELMGFQLAGPDLRAAFERDLELVCRGAAQPAEVLERHLREYKRVFSEVSQQIRKLDEGVARFVSEQMQPAPAVAVLGGGVAGSDVPVRACPAPACGGVSGGQVRVRQTRDGGSWMLGCTNYPGCRHTIWVGREPAVLAVTVAKDDQDRPVVCANQHSNSRDKPVHKVAVRLCNESQCMLGDVLRDESGVFVVCFYCNETAREALGIKLPDLSSRPVATTTPVRSVDPTSHQQDFRHPLPPPPLGEPTNAAADNIPLCQCNLPSIKKKVFKEGPNKGRFFHTCASSSCKFFAWAGVGDTTSVAPAIFNSNTSLGNGDSWIPSSGSSMSHSVMGQGPPSSDSVNCNCDKPAKKLTVMKESANKGRQFFTCSQCNFFQWADEAGPTGGGSGRSRGQAANGRAAKGTRKRQARGSSFDDGQQSSSFTDQTSMWPPIAQDSKMAVGASKGPRRCTRCRMPGHTIKRCPQ